jgi:hypothetical protein
MFCIHEDKPIVLMSKLREKANRNYVHLVNCSYDFSDATTFEDLRTIPKERFIRLHNNFGRTKLNELTFEEWLSECNKRGFVLPAIFRFFGFVKDRELISAIASKPLSPNRYYLLEKYMDTPEVFSLPSGFMSRVSPNRHAQYSIYKPLSDTMGLRVVPGYPWLSKVVRKSDKPMTIQEISATENCKLLLSVKMDDIDLAGYVYGFDSLENCFKYADLTTESETYNMETKEKHPPNRAISHGNCVKYFRSDYRVPDSYIDETNTRHKYAAPIEGFGISKNESISCLNYQIQKHIIYDSITQAERIIRGADCHPPFFSPVADFDYSANHAQITNFYSRVLSSSSENSDTVNFYSIARLLRQSAASMTVDFERTLRKLYSLDSIEDRVGLFVFNNLTYCDMVMVRRMTNFKTSNDFLDLERDMLPQLHLYNFDEEQCDVLEHSFKVVCNYVYLTLLICSTEYGSVIPFMVSVRERIYTTRFTHAADPRLIDSSLLIVDTIISYLKKHNEAHIFNTASFDYFRDIKQHFPPIQSLAQDLSHKLKTPGVRVAYQF